MPWTFIPGYIDEGLSGISTKKRENFNRMVDDAAEDKFDLVITKEISLFARNTLDSIQYTRELLNHGVGVFFQNDNINTLDEDSELRLSIMSSIAQDELRKLSSRVKFGHQQAIKKNVVLGNSRIFGYQKDNKRLVIDDEEAQMVRELFELYATGKYSMKQIEQIFWEKGYRNHNGNRIAHTTMSNMISNPKYKGWYVGNKVKVVDMFTKKQKFLPPEEWVMFPDETGEIVPAIVSEELWDAANAVLQRRSEDVKNRQGICNHASLLTGKLFCTSCGQPYYRRESRDKQGNVNSKWVCSGKIKDGKESCASFPIYEEEIKPLLYEVFRDTRELSAAMMEEYQRMYGELTRGDNLAKRIKSVEAKIDLNLKKKNKLLELVSLDSISPKNFKEMSETCDREAEELEKELAELKDQHASNEEFRKQMEKIRSVLRQAEQRAGSGAITKDFIDTFIDKIYVSPQDDGSMRLDIKIFTGDTAEKYLKKLKSRAGNINPAGERTGENPAISTVPGDDHSAGHTFKGICLRECGQPALKRSEQPLHSTASGNKAALSAQETGLFS